MLREIPEGVTPVYEHCRNYVLASTQSQNVGISPRGGTTICRLIEKTYDGLGVHDEKVVAVGEANCSDDDQYVKKIGRDISLGRALKVYNETTGS